MSHLRGLDAFSSDIQMRTTTIFLRPALLCILSGLLSAGCGFNYKADVNYLEAVRYATHHNLQAEVDSLAKPFVENGKTPGLVIGVLSPDGESKFYSYGVTDTINQSPMNADTVFPIGSLSKLFLGLMTAQLVDDGIVSWDTNLGEALPDVAMSDDAKAVTLYQLANHTSGLPRQPNNFSTLSYFLEYLFTGNNFYRHYDAEYIFSYLEKFKAQTKRKPDYSNIGYGLLGYIIERITGKQLENLLAEKISQPLHLLHTGYRLERSAAITNRAYGHAGVQPKFIPRKQPVPDWNLSEFLKGSASMYSTASDLLMLAKAHIDIPANLATIINDSLQVRNPKNDYSMSWKIETIEGSEIYYIVGVIAGYTSFIGLDRKQNQAVVMLHNSFDWSNILGYQLLVRLVKAQKIRTGVNMH
jgi:CubicO group peptidase (beta-lactamase class C family)